MVHYLSLGDGVGIVLVSLCDEVITLMYKLLFQTINNIVEYEELVLGLRDAKQINIQQLISACVGILL